MGATNEAQIQYQPMDDEAILQAAEEILRKRFMRHGYMADPAVCRQYLKSHCAHLEHEVFGCIFLDNRHHVLAIEDMFHGTIDGAEVHPREVMKRALHHNAAAIIMYHNHPSGNPEPSAADRAVTTRLKQALSFVDVRVIDHVLVAGTTAVSLAARGWV